jgi:hypothetical protein
MVDLAKRRVERQKEKLAQAEEAFTLANEINRQIREIGEQVQKNAAQDGGHDVEIVYSVDTITMKRGGRQMSILCAGPNIFTAERRGGNDIYEWTAFDGKQIEDAILNWFEGP